MPTVKICGTLVEPRKGYVEKLHRQPYTKNKQSRTLVLPDYVAALVRERVARSLGPAAKETPDGERPLFASRNGTWLWPNNIRTRLRAALVDDDLMGTTPHTLRRTVGTRVTRCLNLEAAREQLGHNHPGVTAQFYVAAAPVGPDVREALASFFD